MTYQKEDTESENDEDQQNKTSETVDHYGEEQTSKRKSDRSQKDRPQKEKEEGNQSSTPLTNLLISAYNKYQPKLLTE